MRPVDEALRWGLTALLALLVLGCDGDEPESAEEEPPAAQETTELDLVSDGRLTVCLDVPVEPFVVRDEGTETGFAGLEVAILQEVAGRLDLQLEVDRARVQRILSGAVLGPGRCDLGGSGLAITEERSERLDFTRPYLQARQAVLEASDPSQPDGNDGPEPDGSGEAEAPLGDAVEHLDETEELAELERFDGGRIGVQAESRGHQLAEQHLPDVEVVAFEQLDELLPALLLGEVDAVLRDLVALAPATETVEGVQVTFTVPAGDPYGFAMRPGRTDGLAAAVNAELQAMADDGTLARLIEAAFDLA